MKLTEQQADKMYDQLQQYSEMVKRLIGMYDQCSKNGKGTLIEVLSLLDRGDVTNARAYVLRALLVYGELAGPELLEALELKMKADAERIEE